jgi:preprotein translocase subunit SecA
LGTEKHESRRIDNQLRGRAWRQWDPWVSVFFVALDDEIMRKMWWEKIQSLAGFMFSQQELEQLELTQSQFTASLERAQKQMEWRNFSIRKHLFDYDSVINKQRQRIYAKREILLQAESLDATISEIKKFLPSIAQKIIDDHKHLEDSKQQIIDRLSKDFSIVGDFWGTISHKIVVEQLEQRFDAIVDWLGDKKDLIRNIYLDMIDKLWIEHIDDMQYLREKVSLYGYAQIDPLIVYKSEAFQKFEQLLHSIKYETTATLCKISLEHMSVSSQHDQSSIVDIQQKIDILPNEFVSKSQSSHPDRKDAYVVADQSPHQPNQKFQRNQMVTITKNGQEKTIKYKKAELLLTQWWVIKK